MPDRNKYRPRKVHVLADDATIDTPNCIDADQFMVTLRAAGRTMPNPSNPEAGQALTLIIKQDGTGSRTITTWGSAYRFIGGGAAPTLSTAAGAVDILTFQYNDLDAKWNQTIPAACDVNGPSGGGGGSVPYDTFFAAGDARFTGATLRVTHDLDTFNPIVVVRNPAGTEEKLVPNTLVISGFHSNAVDLDFTDYMASIGVDNWLVHVSKN
jgi:hypothetical protein